MEERRITDSAGWDASLILAILYTLLYAGMVGTLVLVDVPPTNEKTVDMLIGIMSAIQMSIVGRYFGGSKSAEDAQRLIAQSKERTDSVFREVVAKAAPAVPEGKPVQAGDMHVEADTVNVTKEKK